MADDTLPDPADEPTSRHMVLRQESRAMSRLRAISRHRWARRIVYAAGAVLLLLAGLYAFTIAGLPDARQLQTYQPPLPTLVRDIDGNPVHSYARERRVQLDYADFPPQLVHAFLSAEDKTFFSHSGVDFTGLAGAVVDYATKLGSGSRARGGSTITQQVAKNILLGDEYSVSRKLKEMLLAFRIERVLTKQQILELYLNEIPLGRQSFGVQAAARAYFNKDIDRLDLPEMAFLAILPKAPERYGRPKNEHLAIARRNWVLGEMRDNGWISESERAAAAAAPLGLSEDRGSALTAAGGGYYMEEVRRFLKERFGETADDSPNSIYAGGLWVRTAFDATAQDSAATALRAALLRYDAGRGWTGPVGHIEPDAQWPQRLASSNRSTDFEDWSVAVVLKKSGGSLDIGLPGGRRGLLPAGNAAAPYRKNGADQGVSAFQKLKAGDLVLVKPAGGNSYTLRNNPDVSGGLIAEDPTTGRIVAMQGGFDANLSSFNRATQAMRQPGSTAKPFVYATALDNGMTPASIIVDGPFCIWQSASLGRKCFTNFGGSAGAGPQTMRWGLEQSRNLMTVRTANDVGMSKVVKTFTRMGIGTYQPYLSIALGAGETTVERMTNAFAMLVNNGRELKPHLIDYVQDRRGKVIWPEKWTPCDRCNAKEWDGSAMPRFAPDGRQLMDPITAYQVVHMLEGVVQRGTATGLASLNRPLMGKTGTTNGPTNVWFIGGTPQLIVGTYMGYDAQQRSMASYMQGGTAAVPIARQFLAPLVKSMTPVPFPAAGGVRMVRIDRRSGQQVYGAWPTGDSKASVIWEAFKPSSERRRSNGNAGAIEAAAPRPGRRSADTRRDTSRGSAPPSFAEQQGGVY